MKLFITLCFILCSLNVHAQTSTFSFAVVPQQSASKLAKLWIPILEQLSKETGLTFEFKTTKDIPTFEKKLASGAYDFAYMNPYHFTVFNQSPGYQALVKAKDKKIKGIMVVKKESPIQTLSNLNNTDLAFPSPAAFAASILTRSALSSLGNDYQPHYVSSHDSVYRAVAKGLFPAGGGVVRTFRNLDADIQQQLRILWTSEGYTPHAIASHPKINRTIQNKVTQAFQQFDQNNSGKTLLSNIKLKGFSKANNKDWDDVRSLRIDLLTDLIQ